MTPAPTWCPHPSPSGAANVARWSGRARLVPRRRLARRSTVSAIVPIASLRSRLLGVLAVVGVAAALLGATPAGAADRGTPPGGSRPELLSVTELSPRLEELRLFSPTLGRETSVRVLTPEGFDPRHDHLPVLWLLHGGFGGFRDWTDVGDAEALTAGLPLVVVMPDGGTGGWYADWQEVPAEGPHLWETYHLQELRPFIEERYGTRKDRGGRAVVGLSMGGFGALHYAARHPDLFGFAAAFSGAVDILNPAISEVVRISPLAHGGRPGDIFGDRTLDETRWRANNPVELAANLRTVEVQLRTGNGLPGGAHGGGPDVGEAVVAQANTTLHERLEELGIDHVFDVEPGVHSWPYWRDDLRATLPGVLAAARRGHHVPPRVEHVAFEPAFSAWGYDVVLDRPVLETAVLATRRRGFELTGTGQARVTTPAEFRPGQPVWARVTSSIDPLDVVELVAGADGRVTVPVDLGPPSTVDEYPLGNPLSNPPVTARVHLHPGHAPAGLSSSHAALAR
jgi:S-formylglutathione hydrolase FrmB